ncbi:hydrophobic/amphiphilic exporter-1, HAE1 family [Shimia gijangensis]|uniref:Efflux pump membrane transporter n=1 Tax=Shimia gijangensis TaxID=1470563 RepID=A0A1M6SKV1_9RHOB|nr:efflux RND transporter permease subunit [Shimia gijangensis]SHK45229.1 hydrophobic/amphiphilic exporter-1, HAE1 family [Shimia gijangensis]
MFFDIFINRPRLAFVISALFVLLGVIGWQIIPVSQYPAIAPPTVVVTVKYPGASARTLEQVVAQPIENEVNGTKGMVYMKSSSNDGGLYALTVSFEIGTDVDLAAVDVKNRVQAAEPLLPAEARQQGISVRTRSPDLVQIIAFQSTNPEADSLYLANYLNLNVIDEMKRINGVGDAVSFGAAPYAMRIWVENPTRLANLGLTEGDIVNAVRSQNIIGPAGTIGSAPTKPDQALQLTVITPGLLLTPAEFEGIYLAVDPNGGEVKLGDVARVEIGGEYDGKALLDGGPTAAVGIYLSPGANAVNTAAAVTAKLEHLAQRFPAGMSYVEVQNNAEFVNVMIKKVIKTFVEALVLVTVIVYLFLGSARATLIPLLAVPVSVIGTIAVLNFMGYSANTISLLALILAIGIVVDDAIIVVENVERVMHDRPDLSVKQATSAAMGDIFAPILGTTLVLLAVFVPVATLPGSSGVLYREFAVTISSAMLLSMISALTLSPALSSRLMKHGKLPWIMQKVSHGIDAVARGYGATTKRLLSLSVLSLVAVVGFGWMAAKTIETIPSGFVPGEDKGSIMVAYQLPAGASMARTKELSNRAEQFVRDDPAIRTVLRIDGLDLIGGGAASNAGVMFTKMKDYHDREGHHDLSASATVARLRGKLNAIPDATFLVVTPPTISGMGATGGFDYVLEGLTGQEPEEMAAVSKALSIAGMSADSIAMVFSGFDAATPQVKLDIDRSEAARLGVSLPDIYATLQARLGGAYVNDFNRFGRNWQVKIQGDTEHRSEIEDLLNVRVQNSSGELIPVHAFADAGLTAGPRTLTRYNNYRAVSLNGSPALGFGMGEAMNAMEEVSAEALPDGFAFEWSGLALQQKQAAGKTALVIGLAFLFAYLFLVALYESTMIPIAVLLTVSVAILGAVLSVKYGGLAFDLYTQIGMVVLIALAAKNAIIMYSFCLEKRNSGMPLKEATVEGARMRFRPIMMTSLAFIMGLVPLVEAHGPGSGAMGAVGIPVLFGMLAAATIGLLIAPMLFMVFQGLRERFGWKPTNELPA